MSVDILNKSKVPTTKDNYIGIEIEFLSTKEMNVIKKWLVDEKLEYNCQLGEDGSIQREFKTEMRWVDDWIYDYATNQGRYERVYKEVKVYKPGFGYELRVLCTEKELNNIIKRVSKVLTKASARVNKSCGLHVHLDMRNRDPIKLGQELLKKEKELFSIVAPERKKNKYCKPSKIRDIKKALNTYTYSRYKAINLSSYKDLKTIEVRCHEGTVKSTEIINWCKYLLSIIDKRKLTKKVVAYAKKRIEENSIKAA